MSESHATPEQQEPLHAEPNQFSVRLAVFLGLGLLGVLILAMILMGGMFLMFARRVPPIDVGDPSLNAVTQQQVEPRLTVEKRENLSQLRATQARILQSYRWIDEEAGVVQIPIDRAVDILAERGLPARDSNKQEQE